MSGIVIDCSGDGIAIGGVAVARAQESKVKQRERTEREHERQQHLTWQRRLAWLPDDRHRMHRREEVHTQVDEWNQKRAENPEYG